MCMKNRFSKVVRGKSWALILLAISGVASSCKDEYLLDDEKPKWLDVSIYESLQRRGDFSNYLRLLADPDVNNAEDADNNRGLVDVLSKTGSKTVFVANDSAWNEFYRNNALLPATNPWHYATSYDKLSTSQKKLLIHTSMLNNAVVTENLASSEGSEATRGMYMRRLSDVETTDTITYIPADQVPVNYNLNNGEKDYWGRFRAENGGNGLYLVNDSTQSMMLHFTSEYLTRNNITDEDFRIISGQERVTSDVHIYDHMLLEKDAVCENGYINTTQGVLKPLASMAETLRTNGKTNIFSHMLDRWSAPFYSPTITQAYKNVMAAKGIEWTDSIFVKRYFSERSFDGKNGGTTLTYDPNGLQFRDAASTEVTLKFDPGWNGYFPNETNSRSEMGSMYVPTDEALWNYFQEGGGGWQLIQTYCDPTVTYSPAHTPEDYEKLYRNIDQIPISTLRSLINVIMFPNFTTSVPSKMTKLRDDAQEQIFTFEDREHVIGSMMASNGIIYLTNKVYGPADYTSVAAPAYISKDNLVMRWAIYNGSTSGTNYMNLNYYAYLKAMQSRFVFLLPSDEAVKYIYDPVSFKSRQPRVMQLSMNDKSTGFPINSEMYRYEPETGEITTIYRTYKAENSEITNRLKDILESHTIVLEGMEEINSDVNEFYIAKNGSPVRVTRENGKVVKVQGGFQVENESKGLAATNPGVIENLVTDEQNMNNGTTYILNSPMINASRSVYAVLTNDGKEDNADYQPFYELCLPKEEIITGCGLVDKSLSASNLAKELQKYEIFSHKPSGTTYAPDQDVLFFNNYRYTVFVPTAQSLQQAIDNGLPTWNDIEADYIACEKNDANELVNPADSLRLQTKITYLVNFVRNHFIDNSVFVDKSDIPSSEYVTASYDDQKGLFNKVNIQRTNGVLQVKDTSEGEWLTIGGNYNILTRDVVMNQEVRDQTMNGKTIDGSSFAVIHQIPGVLNHTTLDNGRYDSTWTTTASCRQYLKRHAIK